MPSPTKGKNQPLSSLYILLTEKEINSKARSRKVETFNKFIHYFNFWLRWIFTAVPGFSPCGGLPCRSAPALSAWALAIAACGGAGSWCGSTTGLGSSLACGILPRPGIQQCHPALVGELPIHFATKSATFLSAKYLTVRSVLSQTS